MERKRLTTGVARRAITWLPWAALVATIIGARLWLISFYGSSLPFHDQWDAEAAYLFKPWLESTLRWADLFSPHNEHRIVLSRLLALGLLQLNGQWDALLEMTANAVLCGLIGLGVAAGLLRIVGREHRLLVLTTVILWLALPYAHENTLWGFQSGFYFLLLFSLLAIWGLGFSPAWSRNWWLGAIGAILACFSMASGSFAAAVVLILTAVRLTTKQRPLSELAPTCLFALVVVALGLYLRTTYPAHEVLKAASFGAWLNAFARCLAWPYCTMPILTIVMYLPWAICTFLVTTKKGEFRTHGEILFATGAWVIAQAAVIAYARGQDGNILISSRYMDILGLGAAVNALGVVILIKSRAWRGKRKAVAFALGVIWLAGAIGGEAQLSLQKLMSGSGKEALLPMEENVRAYVATHDLKYLDGDCPYPDANRLANLLDDPTIRKILPATVRPALPIKIHQETGRAFVASGYPAELTTPPYERSWGSYSQSGPEARGSIESESFHSPSPYLQFEVAGALRDGMSLSLRNEKTGKDAGINSKAQVNYNWRSAIVPVPGDTVHIVANDDSAKKWLAFREPRELGRFGYYAQGLVSNGKNVLIFGIAISTLLIVNTLAGLLRLSPSAKSDERPLAPKPLKNTLAPMPLRARLRSMSAISWLLLASAVAPALLAFRVQKKHWVNIPIWDEWDTPGIALLRHAQGILSWGDLFVQHNESRKVVPRLIHIAIASVAGWDVRQGMVLTFLCACAASAWALVYLRRRAPHSLSQVLFPWLLINLFLFAPSQYENFLSGFAFEFFIPFLCLFGCCAINLSRWPFPVKVICNSFLALLSTYTFAHGMLLWAFTIPIPTREEHSRGARFFLLGYALYFIAGVIAIAGYFVGYTRPDIAPLAGLAHLPQLVEFIGVWLGSVLRSPLVNPRVSGVFFSAVMIATVVFTFLQLRTHRERWRNYYQWLLLLAFAFASGAVTAFGRVTIGVDDVFNTSFHGFSGMRYNATSVFAYVAVIGLLFNLYQDRIRSEPVGRRRFLIGVTACCTLVAVAWIEMFLDESTRVKQFQANRRRARTAVIWINALRENPEIFLAYPYPDFFWQRVEQMRAAGLLQLPKVSHSLREAIANLPAAADPENGRFEVGDPLPPAYHRFAGWVRNPVKKASASYAVLGWQDAENSFYPFTAIPTGQVRPDVASTYGPSSLKAGFAQDVETSRLPREARTIKAWAIDWETQEGFPIEGVIQLERQRVGP